MDSSQNVLPQPDTQFLDLRHTKNLPLKKVYTETTPPNVTVQQSLPGQANVLYPSMHQVLPSSMPVKPADTKAFDSGPGIPKTVEDEISVLQKPKKLEKTFSDNTFVPG